MSIKKVNKLNTKNNRDKEKTCLVHLPVACVPDVEKRWGGKEKGGEGGGVERKGTSVPTFLIQGYTSCQVLLYATKGM